MAAASTLDSLLAGLGEEGPPREIDDAKLAAMPDERLQGIVASGGIGEPPREAVQKALDSYRATLRKTAANAKDRGARIISRINACKAQLLLLARAAAQATQPTQWLNKVRCSDAACTSLQSRLPVLTQRPAPLRRP
jgi:hypothetical protein